MDLTPDEATEFANELAEAVDELKSASRTGGGQNLTADVSPRAES